MNDEERKEIHQKLLDQCYRFIARRPRTKKELQDYINKITSKIQMNQIDKLQIINSVTKTLEEEKMIDDFGFISWWVEQRSAFRPRSKKALVYELLVKGIEKKDIDSFFEQNEMKEEDQALSLLKQKKSIFRKLSKSKLKQKVIAYLLSRGFSYTSAKIAFEEWMKKG